ncbi:hypothetical protein ACFLQI_00280 [Candidatus Undinarchaeota archaeon]
MAKKSRPAVILVQPWTFVKSYSARMPDLADYLTKLRSFKINGYVILVNYSTHVMEPIYDVADYKVLIEINDSTDLLVDQIDPGDIETQLDDALEKEWKMTPDQIREHDKDDYWSSSTFIDPYAEADKWFQGSIGVDKDFHTWRSMNPHGSFEKMSHRLKGRIDEDFKNKKAVLLRYDEQGATMVNAVAKAIEEENKRNEAQIEEVHIVGGWGNDCIEWVIDNAESLKRYQVKLLGKLIVMKKHTDFSTYYQESLSGRLRKKANLSIETENPVEYLEHEFDVD